ncbi:MAG: TatD family hydrolase [Deltaproteobacteria bacterium]|nr:TatD family hydrolase [Deltaproteobacteria bacterium]
MKGGITHIIAIGINVSSSIKALELAKTYDFVFSTIGFHPHNADDADPDRLIELSRSPALSRL